MTKIVLIGAGSASFGRQMLDDIAVHARALGLIDLWLVDTNAQSLELMSRYAARVFAGLGHIRTSASSDRRAALPDADFVIVSVAVDRIAMWKLDWQIPLRHGVRHVLGENGGPGGLSHSLRSIALMMPIARDVQSLAPKALLLNFTNPLSRVCLALHCHSKVKFVGLCHQIGAGYRLVQKVLDLVAPATLVGGDGGWAEQQLLESRYHLQACGINHFSFITKLIDRASGEDLYPSFARALQNMPADFEPMSRRIFDTFGLFCATGDRHAGEYVGYAADTMELKGYDFDAHEARRAGQVRQLRRVAEGELAPTPRFSGERAIPIIDALVNARSQHELAVNVPNQGFVLGLPAGTIVEVPGDVVEGAVRGELQAPLPRGISSMLRTQCEIQELVVEGAIGGDRKPLLQALLLDPTIRSYMQAEHLLDDLLRANEKYLYGP